LRCHYILMSNPSPTSDFLAEVLANIGAHSFEPMNVAQLASVAGFSPYHFSRLFTARFGESVMSYVRTCRLQAAALRLTGDAPMSLLTVEHIGSYMEIGRAFETLFSRAAALNLLTPQMRMIGVYCDDPTAVSEDSLRSRAAIAAPPGVEATAPLRRLETRGGEYAVLRHKGPYADMRAAYLWLFGTWLPQSDREAADAPVMEEYLNNPRDTLPSELLTELLLPLR
jgi:AraC family transcriptional regulator